MSDEHADVVVVGAGPAGATTACWLADQGLSVALLEKGTFPRDKVCGDGLTPRATKQLLRLGIDVSEELVKKIKVEMLKDVAGTRRQLASRRQAGQNAAVRLVRKTPTGQSSRK